MKCFVPVELFFADHEKKALYRFAIVDNLPGLLDIAQIVLDSCVTGLKNVYGLEPVSEKLFSVEKLAEKYGLRKRNFDEKLDNVKTYTIPE